VWVGALELLSVQLFDVEHLESLSAQSPETLVNSIVDGPDHQLEEATRLLSSLVRVAGRDGYRARHFVHTSITHLLDLHEERDDNFKLATSEVMLEDVLVHVEDLYEGAQVPLFRVIAQALLMHLFSRQRDDVLSGEAHLQLLGYIHAQLENEFIDQLGHIHLDQILHLVRAQLLCKLKDVCTG